MGAGALHLLVAGEDPDADAGGRQALNALGHPLLQLVLDRGAAQQLQPLLDFLRHRGQALVAPLQRRLGCKEALLPPAWRAP